MMWLWLTLFFILIAGTLGGLAYLTNRLGKCGVFGGLSKYKSFAARAALVIAVFALLSFTLNLMNAVICLLHLVVFWLACDAVFALVKRFSKRGFAPCCAGAAALVLTLASLGYGWYADHHVRATFYTIETPKDVKDLRIVMFADSHIGTTFDGAGFARHVRKMREMNPDIVVIAGDFVDDGTMRAQMEIASAVLKSFDVPVYFAFGNHDKGYHNPALRGFTGRDLTAELRKNGVIVLQDESAAIDGNYLIVGRNDASETMRGGNRKDMAALMQNADKRKFSIVIDHQPNDYDAQTAANVDLVLSGHTHGGQLFPLNKVGEYIGANDKTYGFERRGLTDFIVTSGISDWAVKFKTGCFSEFTVIDIKKK